MVGAFRSSHFFTVPSSCSLSGPLFYSFLLVVFFDRVWGCFSVDIDTSDIHRELAHIFKEITAVVYFYFLCKRPLRCFLTFFCEKRIADSVMPSRKDAYLSIWTSCLRDISYGNDTIIDFTFEANKNKDNSIIALAPSNN